MVEGAMKLMNCSSEPVTFWDWLAANTDRIQGVPKTEMRAVMAEVGVEFRRSYPDLVWEIGIEKTGPWVFCISADGDPSLFPGVIEAVEAAPPLVRWKVQAFRARGSLDVRIDIRGTTLDYDDIWCRIATYENGLAVQLCIRGLTASNEEALGGAALVLLDNALGEFDAVTRIKALGRAPLPDDPQRTEYFLPLAKLPALIDRIFPSELN